MCAMAGVAVGTAMFSQLGVWFTQAQGGSPLIEPASGFVVAAILVFGPWVALPAIYTGSVASFLLVGTPPSSALAGALGLVIQAILAWWLVGGILRADTKFPSLMDFFRFVAGACFAGPLAAAAWLTLSPPNSVPAAEVLASGAATWQSLALGTLLFGPFFLLAFRRQDFRPHQSGGAAELLGYSALLGGLVYLLLSPHAMGPTQFMALCASCAFLAIVVALRFGLRPCVLFLVTFVLLVPAYSSMFPDQARGASAMARAREQFGSPEGIALLMAFGCLALAACRDELVALRVKFALAMSSADLCVWDWSEGGWACHTPAWREKFALPSDSEIAEGAWKEMIHPEDRPAFENGFARLVSRTDQSWSDTYRMRDAAGTWRWVCSHAQALRMTADDEVAFIAGVTRDITEERAALRNEISAIETEAELLTLRSQLNPHFLFNALNSVRALIGRDDDRARTMVSSLGKLLRTLLTNRDEKIQSVAQELGLVHNYLEIEKIRFGERIQAEIACEESLLPRRLPGLLLLTLVENAVKHGISKLAQGGKIDISITQEASGAVMIVSVVNDGALAHSGSGVGLMNTRRRIALATSGEGTLELQEIEGPRVAATARFPDDGRRIPAPPAGNLPPRSTPEKPLSTTTHNS